MVINKDEVCIFIPTLNEAPTIESLILSFKEMGYGDILVMDGKSTQSSQKDELVTADVAAEMLCISRRTLYTWISVKRILPVTCIGRKRLFRKKDIEALVAHNTINNR